MKNLRIVCITRFDKNGQLLGNYCQEESEANVVLDEMKDAEPGESWKLELIEMSENDYNQMPEFQGY